MRRPVLENGMFWSDVGTGNFIMLGDDNEKMVLETFTIRKYHSSVPLDHPLDLYIILLFKTGI
jgi:hypothetical protein